MDNFNEGLESFDEDWLNDFDKEYDKLKESFENLLSKDIDKLKEDNTDSDKNFNKFSEKLNELDVLSKDIEDFSDIIDEMDKDLDSVSNNEKAEVLEYLLKDRFFLIGLDNYNAFAKLVSKEIPDYKDDYSVFGFALSDLEDLNDKFKEYDITAFFIKYELMVEASMKVDTERLFSFEPIKGGERKGILIPVQCDLNKDKPERYSTIDEIDVNILGSKLDAFNKGEISFEDFLGSV